MTDLYLLGAGIRGKLVADLVEWDFAASYRVRGFFDDALAPGAPVIGPLSVRGDVEAAFALPPEAGVFVAFGTRYTFDALRTFAELRKRHRHVVSLVSPRAHVAPSASLGANALLCPGAVLGSYSAAGDLLCMHANAVVEHDSSVGSAVLLGPGASVASGVRIGDAVFVGAGATISESVAVGDGAIIGAGAVVVRDVPPFTVSWGNPSRVRRQRTRAEGGLGREELQSLAAQGRLAPSRAGEDRRDHG